MFKLLLQFEVFYQLKQRALPLLGLIFFFYGLMMSRQGFAPANVDFNSAYQLSYYTNLFTLGCVFIVMFFSISGVLRDPRFNMTNLIHSTSVKKYHFFWSRFIGVFMFSLLAFSPYLIGSALGFAIFDLDVERISTFNISAYLWPWLITVVPNVFICSTLVFSVSTLTKSNTATYASAIFIYMLYMISSMFLNSPLIAQSVPVSPEAMATAALADPFGISAFFEQTQFWTPFQKNTQLLSFSGLYMWNRLLWIAFSFGVLAITYRLFSFRKLNYKVKKINGDEQNAVPIRNYRTIQPRNSFKSKINTLLSLLKIELAGVFKSLPFLIVMIIWVVISIASIYSRVIEGGAYQDSWYPFTNLIIELILDPLKFLSFILIVFYSAEIVSRERNFNINGIIDATPTSNSLFFISKYVALILLPLFLIASGIIVCIGFQLVAGYYNLEIAQYFSLFYFSGLQLIIFSVVALFIQSVVKNKYLGMGITGMLIIASFISPYIGIEYPLLRIGFLPTPDYSNMTGFSGAAKLFNNLAIYWIALGGILSILSFKLWKRGITTEMALRLGQLFSNWKKRELVAFGLFIIVFTAAGTTFYYNRNVINEYITSTERLDFREAYERKFKQYDSLEILFQVRMKTEVDLFPNENKYTVKSNYILKNNGENIIKKMFITERVPLTSISLEKATLVAYDSVFGTYLFEFEEDIMPQQELKFSYELIKKVSGFETDQTIIANGSYISHRNFEPVKSYRSSLEISDPFERKKRNMPKLIEEEVTDEHLYSVEMALEKVNYETIISTRTDEIAVGTGELVRQWSKNGRNYFHYKSVNKVVPTMAYFSARYTVKKKLYNGISIEQYYDENHGFNIDTIGASIRATLDYCNANFGSYPFEHIRMAEIPSHWPFGGFAHPGVISMVEDNLYLINIQDADNFNLVAKRTIHEVAHQWWGHVLVPKLVPGGSIFVEGFAKYTEAVILEKMYGKRALFQLIETANNRYFSGRSYASSAEPPLYLVDDQSYLSYGKSLNVMLALRELIGEQKVNKILKTLADRHRDSPKLEVHSLEFLDEIYSVTPEKYHVLIDDWFKKVITYDLSIGNSSVKVLNNGKFEVSIEVKAQRFEMDEKGVASKIGINEPISIALLDTHPNGMKNNSSILYVDAHNIQHSKTNIKIVVDKLPKYVAIDLFGTRSDENLVDNIAALE